MFKKVLLTIGLLLAAHVAVLAQGTIKGTVTDAKNGEPIPFVNVVIKQDGQQKGFGQTDFDGIYTIKSVDIGKYDIEASYVGYTTHVRQGIQVKATGFTVIDIELSSSAATLKTVEVTTEKQPLFEKGTTSTGKTLGDEDIKRMPGNSVDAIVSTVAGVGYSDGGTGTARGQDGMVTMQGTVRKRTGISAPKEAIGEIKVILGGTPASIGEAVGGAQIITLKPPQSKFIGVAKWETYLDYRMANSFVLWLTGPLYKKRTNLEGGGVSEVNMIGFRATLQGSFSKYPYYRARDGRYQVVKDDIVAEIEKAPIVYDPLTGSVNYAAEYLRADDFVTITRPTAANFNEVHNTPNFTSWSAGIEGAIDFRPTAYTSLVLTGEFSYSKGPNTSLSYFPFNLHNAANGVVKSQNYVVTLDFTQRFPDPVASSDATDPNAKKARFISNVMWNATVMYNLYRQNAYNEVFGDHLFRYGHVGTFVNEQERSYAIQSDYNYNGTSQMAYVQNAWRDNIVSFTPSEYNPILANYTSQLYNIPEISAYLWNTDNIQAFNGLINGGSPNSVYGLFSNVGVQSTTYQKVENNYYYGQAKIAATIAGKHDVEIGFQYDQYTAASYGLAAGSLWTIMRQQANSHITQLALDEPWYEFKDGFLYVNYDRMVGDGQTTFDESMRNYLASLDPNVQANTWLDVDRYSPDWFEEAGGLDMFSAADMLNSGNAIASWAGFDHTGTKYDSRTWNLDDFFNPVVRDHPKYQYLPVFSPIYMAGYIQDKFYFSDLIFNVGVRVDRFDGNQYVLKDPYLLYDSYTVGDLRGSDISYNTGLDGNAFANAAQDDWVVYVDDPTASTPTIRGYRNGSIWYDANGVEIASPSSISGESGRPTPFRTADANAVLVEGNESGNKVRSQAFEDYTPQWVVQPRIAFSFPVGEKSQFSANYDIIARRPSSGWTADYVSYLYMTQISSISNPNLKPERITNYEIGFNQALNDKSAISINAYYKETRDLIQLVQYAGADPNPNYYSYDNLDFMTTKGFSFTYDLRHSNNIRLSANYTLQYAEGTGLSTTTMSELIKEGYTTLKMLNPISDDRRHEFKANLDYRYFNQEGPKLQTKKKDKETGEVTVVDHYPLQNFGVNLVAVAQSGRPYTRAFSNTQQTIVGSYRGARLPWGFYFDLVVDKTWPIAIKKDGKIKRNTALNAALTVRNLFDTRNITGVFSVTGNPTDNGYLSDPETQTVINSYLDPQSFRDMYQIWLSNSYWNYSTPRIMYLSLSYQF